MARVLVVDDDSDILLIVRMLLSKEGHTVSVFETVMEAVESAKRNDFDLVLTDANMSPHSGYDFIRTLRTMAKFENVPIAMLTARNTRQDVERALLLGAKDYIVKPIDPEALIKKVRELLQKSESVRLASKFAELEIRDDATATLDLKIIGLTETTVHFDSDHSLREGTPLRVASQLFERIGIGPQNLRVQVSSKMHPEFPSDPAYDIRAGFTSLDEKGRAKVRAFILNQLSRSAKRTAS